MLGELTCCGDDDCVDVQMCWCGCVVGGGVEPRQLKILPPTLPVSPSHTHTDSLQSSRGVGFVDHMMFR
jgi:hypothetical protein